MIPMDTPNPPEQLIQLTPPPKSYIADVYLAALACEKIQRKLHVLARSEVKRKTPNLTYTGYTEVRPAAHWTRRDHIFLH
mmetsp:Transcript_11811/g.18039  ORF Transcript_11811/g.18039 Transcript_11811/m.18039 type:complete len:80 (-) Transcript_11811:121-360(-)